MSRLHDDGDMLVPVIASFQCILSGCVECSYALLFFQAGPPAGTLSAEAFCEHGPWAGATGDMEGVKCSSKQGLHVHERAPKRGQQCESCANAIAHATVQTTAGCVKAYSLLAWREGRGVCRYAIVCAHHDVTMVVVIIVPVLCTAPQVRRLSHAGQVGRIWHMLRTQAAVPCACLLVA